MGAGGLAWLRYRLDMAGVVGSNPTRPILITMLIYGPTSIIYWNSLALSAQYEDPLSVFLYALKAPETKRQYQRRLKVFLDFLKLDGTLEQQSKEFLEKAKQNPQWA